MFLWQLHAVAEWTQVPLLYIATLVEDGVGDYHVVMEQCTCTLKYVIHRQ